ncbi:HLA class II histocompatibility antigen gamma chain [Salmo salar]|uniref:HLA class II histocompatibility antigen gamma chain n=1 Tax=Salmo salar TaxID=8030 RepID=B9EQ96_SALSA|nr:HLA class II histocompatibility antigen gamma chain [Salmo salar]ACM09693.1 HLA class II histocompatibility antigen gamma chain [Salmo salar]ACN10250.1 HLA class II histocompatibility antigen gamma chain [Salmo salar]ACN12606.1 HLA class II histocompatibility antigen gamma chain [Salmo salar]|eukprot:XP_014067965.1 PREDICTED: HLA class II histocompatibility antigen gamma chain-like [Salmo salar]
MEEQQQQRHDDALLERAGSQDVILPITTNTRASNSRAFKVAGLTVLACLLLAGQALTAYLVFNQRGQIHDMQKSNDNMRKQLRNRPLAVAPVKMQMPMLNMARLIDFTDEDSKTPMTNLEATAIAIVSLEDQVKDLLQNPQLPQFNETFLANLQSLKQQVEETEWEGFETWVRYWLLFQMAQEKPPAPPTPQPVPHQRMAAYPRMMQLKEYKNE